MSNKDLQNFCYTVEAGVINVFLSLLKTTIAEIKTLKLGLLFDTGEWEGENGGEKENIMYKCVFNLCRSLKPYELQISANIRVRQSIT